MGMVTTRLMYHYVYVFLIMRRVRPSEKERKIGEMAAAVCLMFTAIEQLINGKFKAVFNCHVHRNQPTTG